jgi:hypothetical protein
MSRTSQGPSLFEWLFKRRVPRELRLHAAVRSLAVAAILAAVLPRVAAASEEERNRCGCYRDPNGACFCAKKATCGCPGECEPRGCEEKRDKDIQKEIEAETKKAEESGRQQAVSKDEESVSPNAPTPPKPAPAHQRLSPAQSKQLVKLIDLYLGGRPGAGGKSLQDVREELSPAR